MKLNKITLPILVIALSSCSNNNFVINSKFFCFNTYVELSLFEGKQENVKDIVNLFNDLDKLTDNYQARNVNNIYTINQTNDEVEIDSKLYDLLKKSFEASSQGAIYFNPFIGLLSKKWKEALDKKEVLSESVINEELTKMASSSLEFLEGNKVKRNGEAELDLGAIAKGYAVDLASDYLLQKEITHYIVNAGSSSVLLGEKNTEDGLFSVGLEDLPTAYLKLKNCVISTSSLSKQGVNIDGVKYSHIINPYNGSAITLHDAVIVISDNGAFGDVMSTSLVNTEISEIQKLETTHAFKSIVIKDNTIEYKHPDIEVNYH